MITKLIEGKSVRADDDKILAAVAKKAKGTGSGGMPMCLGIRNEAGDIYRAFQPEGPIALMCYCEALIDLGLRDELIDVDGMREGCDAIFS